ERRRGKGTRALRGKPAEVRQPARAALALPRRRPRGAPDQARSPPHHPRLRRAQHRARRGSAEVPGRMIEARGVGVSFGTKPVLSNIGFEVKAGEFLCIVGPSGCGKTTLLRLLAGLVAPTEGEIRVAGEKVQGPARERAIV